MFPFDRAADRAMRQGLWKWLCQPDHPIASRTQRRINAENYLMRPGKLPDTAHREASGNALASGQAALHLRELLRRHAHTSNSARANRLAKPNSETELRNLP